VKVDKLDVDTSSSYVEFEKFSIEEDGISSVKNFNGTFSAQSLTEIQLNIIDDTQSYCLASPNPLTQVADVCATRLITE